MMCCSTYNWLFLQDDFDVTFRLVSHRSFEVFLTDANFRLRRCSITAEWLTLMSFFRLVQNQVGLCAVGNSLALRIPHLEICGPPSTDISQSDWHDHELESLAWVTVVIAFINYRWEGSTVRRLTYHIPAFTHFLAEDGPSWKVLTQTNIVLCSGIMIHWGVFALFLVQSWSFRSIAVGFVSYWRVLRLLSDSLSLLVALNNVPQAPDLCVLVISLLVNFAEWRCFCICRFETFAYSADPV